MPPKIVVLGLGISGRSAAKVLLKKGYLVVAADKKFTELSSQEDIQDLVSRGLVLSSEEVSLAGVVQIILSPGIPLSHPLVQQAFQQNIEVVGEVEFAFRHIKNRCIGITGSNGKTTTTLLITHVLNGCGIKARALGNVGVGLSTYLMDPDEKEILVVELSSFQLETLKSRSLDYALILNITENHLDRYPSMREYAEAKLGIQNCLKDWGIFFVSRQVLNLYGCRNAKCFDGDGQSQNVDAAFAICQEFGIRREAFDRALQTFRKPPHRIEWVGEIGGVSYYNDSKSSNIESVLHAMKQFSHPVILIVGGKDKGSSYVPWIDAFCGKIKHVVAYGEAKEKIEKEIGFAFPFTKIDLFADAVHLACEMATKCDTVLLSPGCSSYDQFSNFERRGDAFKELILQRKNGSKKNNPDRGNH